MADNPYAFPNLFKPFAPLFTGLVRPSVSPTPSPTPVPTAPIQYSAPAGPLPSSAPIGAVPANTPTGYNSALAGPLPAVAPVGSTVSNTGAGYNAPVPQIAAPTSYTVVRGDTLSAIAARNNLSLQKILDLNPQFRSNPNLINPGQVVSLGLSTPPAGPAQQPAVPQNASGTVRTPSGLSVNPSTGGVVYEERQPAPPAIPQTAPGISFPAEPSAPAANPLFTSPGYEAASKAYEAALPMTPEEEENASKLANLESGLATSQAKISDQPIPLEFITGQKRAVEERALALQKPLAARAALLQAKRTAALEASKFKLEQESGKLSALREASKPVSVAMGSSLVNPLTGATVASGGSYTDKQAYDTFFNLAQTYPDAKISWNDSLSPQQNLKAALRAAEASPSFEAKQTVYAINPLTGEPTIINKRTGVSGGGGGGAFGAPSGAPAGNGLTVDQLAPELRAALSNVAGVQYFDASKTTAAQLPFLQRASQKLGIPLLDKTDATAIQTDAQKYNSAQALMKSILELTPKVIKASNNQASMTAQAARLRAIQLAPTLSTDNDSKALLATLEAFTSLLTRAAGEKGVLTDTDVRRIKNALPSITDNTELAIQKSQQLNDVFRSSLEGAIQTYIGGATGGGATRGGANNDPLGLF